MVDAWLEGVNMLSEPKWVRNWLGVLAVLVVIPNAAVMELSKTAFVSPKSP